MKPNFTGDILKRRQSDKRFKKKIQGGKGENFTNG